MPCLISQDSFVLCSVLVPLFFCKARTQYACLTPQPPPHPLPLGSFHFSSIWCVNYTSRDYIFLIFSGIKMPLKVQPHNGLKPISDAAAAKRGNNLLLSPRAGIWHFLTAQGISSAFFSKLKVKHANSESKLNLFLFYFPLPFSFLLPACDWAANTSVFCALPLATCCHLQMSRWLHVELNWGTAPSEQ